MSDPVLPAAHVDVVEPGPSARVVQAARRVRLGDASPAGRLRLDATLRYVQDVSDDDTRGSGLDDPGWVVRRSAVVVHAFPTFGEPVQLRTWCAGLGSRWAERRVSLTSPTGRIEVATLWVHVDPQTGRPTLLTGEFLERYESSAGGRTVSSRLGLPDVEPSVLAAAGRWPVRFVDFDALDHVNNAAVWAAVEQHLAVRRELRAPLTAVVEHRRAIERVDLDAEGSLRCAVLDRPDGFGLWLVGEQDRAAVAADVAALGAAPVPAAQPGSTYS